MIYKPTPHDSYFGQMMEIKSVAKSFFISQLPQVIIEALDWDTLKLYESARRNPGRKTSYVDITYTCQLKKENITIYLHCECERSDTIAKLIARIYNYNGGLIPQHLKQGNKKAPTIINFVLYNNPTVSTDSPYSWYYSDVPWIEQLHHARHFYLLNVKQASDEILAGYGPCGIMDLLLKRAEQLNFTEWLKCYGHLVKDIELDDIALDYVVELNLSYILTVAIDKSKDLLEVFSDLYPQYKENFMTVARQLEIKGKKIGEKIGEIRGEKIGEIKGKKIGEKIGEIKGKKIGEKIGEIRGKVEVAKNLLKLNLDIDMVQQATGLTKGELKEIIQ